MKIFLSVGHSILKNGSCTSADGRGKGGVLEYEYCKQLAPHVKKYLEQAGHAVTLVVCPEKQFTKSSEEKSYKIPIENKGGYDMACELHLNAYDGKAHGCEVYYKTANGRDYAERVNAKLAQYFTDRGAQKRDNLYMLNSTKAPAILVECFFCDSASDCSKAKTVGMDALGKAIAEGIANKTMTAAAQTAAANASLAKTKCTPTKAQSLQFPTVSKGCTGVAVKMLQQMIGTPVTGTWTETDAAKWKTFQKNTSQAQDGICGAFGWKAVAAHLLANTFKS